MFGQPPSAVEAEQGTPRSVSGSVSPGGYDSVEEHDSRERHDEDRPTSASSNASSSTSGARRHVSSVTTEGGLTGHQVQAQLRAISEGSLPEEGSLKTLDHPEPLLAALSAVRKVHPSIETSYLIDLVKDHYPKCNNNSIIQCTLRHLTAYPDYPKSHSSGKRKRSESPTSEATVEEAAGNGIASKAFEIGRKTKRRLIGDECTPRVSHDADEYINCEACNTRHHPKAISNCPAGHLFCHPCIFRAATAQLGSSDPSITCLEASCSHPFSKSILLQILPHEPVGVYDRLIQLHTLKHKRTSEQCPRCGWTCTLPMSIDESKRFWCQNATECGAVTCRVCKQDAHGLKSCREFALERQLSEEQLSRTQCRTDEVCSSSYPSFDRLLTGLLGDILQPLRLTRVDYNATGTSVKQESDSGSIINELGDNRPSSSSMSESLDRPSTPQWTSPPRNLHLAVSDSLMPTPAALSTTSRITSGTSTDSTADGLAEQHRTRPLVTLPLSRHKETYTPFTESSTSATIGYAN